MKIASQLTSLKAVLVYFSLIGILTGCGSLTRELEQVSPSTAALEIRVKSALIASETVDSAAILVERVGDVIVLSGFVDSDKEATEAKRLAVKAAESTSVESQLEVR